MPEKAIVFFVEKNIHGGYVVYGSEGIKQYYGVTKAQAKKLYQQSGKTFVNRRTKSDL